nr:hypothetical protein [Tanacetum cinerariifolium]
EDPPKDPPEVPMADDRTMAELLRAPTEGYEDAIDSLNSVAGGNFLNKMHRECLKIIECKSKVRQTRAKAVVAKLLDKKNQSSAPVHSSTPAPVKAVEPNCVTCGGTHSYQNCPATSGNVYRDNIQEYVSQAAAANYNQGNCNTPSETGQMSHLCHQNKRKRKTLFMKIVKQSSSIKQRN